jgi:hypothetical protein
MSVRNVGSGTGDRAGGSQSTWTAGTGRGSLEVETPDRGERLLPGERQPPHELRRENLSALRRGAKPGRLDNRSAETVVPLEDHVAGADPDPDLQRRRARPVLPADRLLDGHRRPHGIRRPREGRHDPIAQVLDQMPPAGLDGGGHQAVVIAAEPVRFLLTESRTEGGRPHQIREKNNGG